METSSDGNIASASQAEELRLLGNTAFAGKKWQIAIQKYRASINIDGTSKGSAKVYSNLAAALCKLCKYDDAYEAAKMAPKVDPDWAKGHWRLGVVFELQKDFMHALGSYDSAVERAPDEPIFAKAFDKMFQRLGCEAEKLPDGSRVVDLPQSSTSLRVGDGHEEPPCYVAWERLKKRTNNFTDTRNAFPDCVDPSDGIKSEWWIAQGLYYWYTAMMRQLGELACLPCDQLSKMGSKLEELKVLRQSGSISQMEFDTKRYQLTGQPPTQGSEFSEFLNGLTHLGGDHIPAEMGGGKIIPSPSWLKWYKPQQFVAVQQVLFFKVLGCKYKLGTGDNTAKMDWSGGEELVLSPAVRNAARSYLANAKQDNDDFAVGKEGTPEEVIEYCKKKLKEGITWEGGIRDFVALIYRGTVLAGWLSRLGVGLGAALKSFKWAHEFIKLADDEWKVSENENYTQCGASFRKSFQVGILWMELVTAQTLRNDETPKLEIAVYEFNLAQEIITIAKKQPRPTENSFDSWMFYTSFSRKPLAFACSYLASTMHSMRNNPDLLLEVIARTGLFYPDRGDNLFSLVSEATAKDEFSVNSMIAETYKLAAMNQLLDDKETAILFWGCAVHIAYAGGYKIVELRTAINNAIIASQKMDEELFGPSVWRGHTYQKQSMLLARYYQDERDDFILPILELEVRPDGSVSLFVDGQVLCMNFDKHLRMEKKKFRDKTTDEYLDTSEIEKEHGAES
mmetsp:Transcript_3531/g.7804  ORF Transcript_3531/g.7804 Transcript_3531/m.7804 type:complete len:735 (-) Transcript_3531:443-2647(-)